MLLLLLMLLVKVVVVVLVRRTLPKCSGQRVSWVRGGAGVVTWSSDNSQPFTSSPVPPAPGSCLRDATVAGRGGAWVGGLSGVVGRGVLWSLVCVGAGGMEVVSA